jgi:hypothetical protein
MLEAIPRRQLEKAKDYRKTAMRLHLTQKELGRVRDFAELPKSVVDARNMVLMFIDQHIEVQDGKPAKTLDNLTQYAMTFRAISGKKLNLTLTPEEDEEQQPVEEKKPKNKKKAKIEIPEDDEEMRQEVMKTMKTILRQRELQALQARMTQLQEEDELIDTDEEPVSRPSSYDDPPEPDAP